MIFDEEKTDETTTDDDSGSDEKTEGAGEDAKQS